MNDADIYRDENLIFGYSSDYKIDGEAINVIRNSYSFNNSLVKEDYTKNGVKGKCVKIDAENKPNNTKNNLCISRNTDLIKFGPPYIENIYANALFNNDVAVTTKNNIKDLYNEKFKDYNPKFYCNESTKCTSILFQELNKMDVTTSDIYNICNNLKDIVKDFDKDLENFDTDIEKNKVVCMKYLGTGICNLSAN